MADTTQSAPAGSSVRLAVLLATLFAASLLGWALPAIPLDTTFSSIVVRITDTASFPLALVLSVGLMAMIVTRPGLDPHRRRAETGVLAMVLLVAVVGNAALNEYGVKPLIGVPRPNIEALAEAGDLGADIPTADAFYALGNKQARRTVLRERLTPDRTPELGDLVRSHWIHETGYSFPSGHATLAVTLASLLAAIGTAWLAGWRKLVAVAAVPLWAVIVVYSRILLEVHRPIDVAAGTVAGIVWGYLAYRVAERAIAASGPGPAETTELRI